MVDAKNPKGDDSDDAYDPESDNEKNKIPGFSIANYTESAIDSIVFEVYFFEDIV